MKLQEEGNFVIFEMLKEFSELYLNQEEDLPDLTKTLLDRITKECKDSTVHIFVDNLSILRALGVSVAAIDEFVSK